MLYVLGAIAIFLGGIYIFTFRPAATHIPKWEGFEKTWYRETSPEGLANSFTIRHGQGGYMEFRRKSVPGDVIRFECLQERAIQRGLRGTREIRGVETALFAEPERFSEETWELNRSTITYIDSELIISLPKSDHYSSLDTLHVITQIVELLWKVQLETLEFKVFTTGHSYENYNKSDMYDREHWNR